MTDKFIQMQNQIRQNSYSVHDYVSELTDWTDDIFEKDKSVKEGKVAKPPAKKLPPIRSVKLENERLKHSTYASYLDTVVQKQAKSESKVEQTVPQDANPNDVNDYKRDVTPMPAYYNKWDSYNVDEGIKSVENETTIGFDKTLSKNGDEITKKASDSKMYKPTEYDDDLTPEERKKLETEKFLKGTSGARPNTQIVVKGGAMPTPMSEIEYVKNQGNSHFKTCDYEKAATSYTKCLEMNPGDKNLKVTLYSNRAQCNLNLKDYLSAQKDALSAIRLDRYHLKARFRHGTALYYLKRYKEAKREFNNLLKIDSKNKGGLERLQQIEVKLSKIKQEAFDKLKFGEIIGDSTSASVDVINVELINNEQSKPANTKNTDLKEPASGSMVSEVDSKQTESKQSEADSERESRTNFLSKTDVSNITRAKGETTIKPQDDDVYEADELEELKKLQQERDQQQQNSKKKNKRNRKKNKKKGNKVVVTGGNQDEDTKHTDDTDITNAEKDDPNVTSNETATNIPKPTEEKPPTNLGEDLKIDTS